MKKALNHLIAGWVILSVLIFSNCTALAFETQALIPQIKILIRGTTTVIDVIQNDKFPQDFSEFLIVAIGYGVLNITLRNIDTEEEFLLILTGVGISSAGIAPIFRFGRGKNVTLKEGVEIGSERSPCGLLWISSWVDSENDPPYDYTLTLSF